jgi:hypothetical protein
VYFLQYASSWGQLWSKEHWKEFREWYTSREKDDSVTGRAMPPNIRLWPANSWKKYFIEFLISRNKFFVFPRVSFTTIFSDEGTNIRIRETFLQVALWYGERNFHFMKFEDSLSVYDTYCEILPDRLKKLWKKMEHEDFEVDLYGMKPSASIHSTKIISGRTCKDPQMRFGREMRPQEENVIHGIPGDYYSLGRKEDFEDPPYMARLMKCHEKKELAYWYPIREYHFHKNTLLSTDKKAASVSDPGFLMKKFNSTFIYAYKYFFRKKK